MIKVSDVVSEIVLSSEIARAALHSRILNLSAYAAQIQKEVQRRARKPVQVGTIVVSLARLSQRLRTTSPLEPKVEINNVSVKTGLAEIAFDKTRANRERIQRLYQDQQFLQADFLSVTYGVGELSIFCQSELVKPVLKLFRKQKPKLLLENLAGLTLRFDERYIQIPNYTFALIKPLALKRINVVEVVSTFTELTILLAQSDVNEAFATFTEFLQLRSRV